MSDDALADTIAAGRAARATLSDPQLNDAFVELEAAYMSAWRGSELRDKKGREKLFIAINVLGKVKQHLAIAVADGSLAEAELADLIKEGDDAQSEV